MTPTVQVQILSVVDAEGSASIGDIISGLPGHEEPVGALFALIAAGVLRVLTPGVIDANTVVARAGSDPDPASSAGPVGASDAAPITSSSELGMTETPASVEASLPKDLSAVPTSRLQPRIVAGAGDYRTDFARAPGLQRPGVYILLRNREAYVGYGAEAGFRMIDGRQMPGGEPDCLIGIVDEHDGLDLEDAKALERILWASVAADPDFTLVNRVPGGAPVSPQRYDQLRLFVAQIVLALRQAGLMFLGGSVRDHLMGPVAEPERVGSEDGGSSDGRLLEHSSDISARARERDDGRWLLLAGSQVRIETQPSAPGSAAFLRAAWLHSGLIEISAEGAYVVKRDIAFPSPGTLASFVSGSKRARFTPCEPSVLSGGTLLVH